MKHVKLREKTSNGGASARAPVFAIAALCFSVARCSVDTRLPNVLDDSMSDGDGSQGGAGSTGPEQGGSSSALGGNQTESPGAAAQSADPAIGGSSADGGPSGGSSGAAMGGSTGQCSPDQAACTGTGFALSPVDGWVTRETNGLGVHGSFYVTSDATDGGPSTVTPTTFSASGTEICVQGVAGPVGVDENGTPDYAGDWGVLVGLNLSQLEGGVRGPWSRSTPEGTVAGFSYVLTGPVMPSSLRFSAGSPDGQQSYCAAVTATNGATQTILLQDLTSVCWSPEAGEAPSLSEPLGNLQWDIPALVDEAVPFDFCISELQGIVQ